MGEVSSAKDLRRVLDGRWGEVRDTVREQLDSAEWATPTDPLPMADYRVAPPASC